jgi:hypothetical protein
LGVGGLWGLAVVRQSPPLVELEWAARINPERMSSLD